MEIAKQIQTISDTVSIAKPDSVPAKADQLKNRVYILHIIYYYFFNFKSKNIGHNKDQDILIINPSKILLSR